jgi:hypothetical protein
VIALDLSDLGPVRRGVSPNNYWVVVVEDKDPAKSPLPQQDDPEGETEASIRSDFEKYFAA